MRKSLKFTGIAAAALIAAGGLTAPAAAQSANDFPGGAILDAISVADVSSMMTELGVATSVLRFDGVAEPVLLAQTEGGGVFLFNFFDCKDPESGADCRGAVVSTGLPAGAATYDMLNDFNGRASVTTAVSVPSEQVVIFGRNILVAGGHSRELFQATVYLFLVDVSAFSEANTGLGSVAFRRPSPPRSKITVPVDATEATPPFGLKTLSAVVAAAIDNTDGVGFSAKDPRRP